jgi:Predicted periplasmic solute-binding protein
VIRDAVTFRVALWLSNQGRHLKAGEYRFDRAMTPFEVIDKMARGDVFVVSMTFPEGLTVAEMSKIFESHGLGTAAAFVQAAHDPSLIHDLDPAANDLEGYLFPETYAVPRRTDAGSSCGRWLHASRKY